MNIKFQNRTIDIDPLTVIVRDSGVYAKVQLPGREGLTFTHYVPVDKRLTGLLYTVAEPQPLTVVLTPEMAANVNASALVSIVVRERVSLYSEWMKVA